MNYEIYFDIDDFHNKYSFSNMNIESTKIIEVNDKETAYNLFNKYCKQAFNNANDSRLCVRYNVHIINGWQTIKSKNFYSRRWLREVGELE